MEPEPHLVLLPTPGIGHLIPLAELAARLVHHHHFSVTLILPTNSASLNKAENNILSALPDAVTTIVLPPVSFDDMGQDVTHSLKITMTLVRALPALRDSLAELTRSTRVSAIVVDLFGPPSFGVAKEFGIPYYVFFPVSAMTLVTFLHLPQLDEMYTCEYKDLHEPVVLPGSVPVQWEDMPEPVQEKKSDVYKWVLQMTKAFQSANGFLVNSYVDLEPGAFRALEEGDWCGPEVYPVGPLTQNLYGSGGSDDRLECLKWLDRQPPDSVLFVSFGSGGTLSHEQLQELAMGLELSGQRFLWVVKSPNNKNADASYFSAQSVEDPFLFLPSGFMDRVMGSGTGFVVPSWAPQVEILSHNSTAGFLSHCGWNSTLESIMNGVPLFAWPLFAEQGLNTTLVIDGLKIGLRAKKNENGVVGRDEIARCARCLIEGEEGKEMRTKVKQLKELGAMALSQDGPSTKSLSQVAKKWLDII